MGELYQTICKPFLKQEGFTLNIQEPRVRLRQASMNPEQKEAKAFSLSQAYNELLQFKCEFEYRNLK